MMKHSLNFYYVRLYYNSETNSTGRPMEEPEFQEVRGLDGVKETEVSLGDTTIRVAVAHGTANASRLLEKIKSGEKEYHFIEVMGCPGGCVNGGGQPIVSAQDRMEKDVAGLRASAIYEEDRNLPIRKSHENPSIKKIYEEYLGEPNSPKAHELLHTQYTVRSRY